VTSLAERMTNMEMRLDDLDEKLDNILRVLQALSAANHAEHASVGTPTRSKNGAQSHTSTHSVRTKGTGASASHTSQADRAQKNVKGDH
jgi:hypothetical protein